MCPNPMNNLLESGAPEQLLLFSCIGIKGCLVGTSQSRQIALEVGFQGGDQQGLAKTARSGQKGVLRPQLGAVTVDRSQQSAQMAGLVNVQATAPSNWDEPRLIRVQEGQLSMFGGWVAR